ncbi:MAG: fasciclin domain-containing protein [Rhodobacteraceae bacterium]|nr:fasciclin domain-containing protein [Paracoccaceae bacterium]
MNRRTCVTALAATGLVSLVSACAPMLPGSSGSADDVLGKAAADPDLSSFVAAVTASGLSDRLHGTGPFTVFAPTNAAFARLPHGTLDSLMQPTNQARLAALLEHHVGRGNFPPAMLQGQALQIATLDGTSVVADGRTGLSVDRVAISAAIPASNGVILKIARVLMPKG